MRNLDQIRASEALRFWSPEQASSRPAARGANDGDVINKLPAMIRSAGLLATVGYAKDRKGGHEVLMSEIARFLTLQERALLPELPKARSNDDKTLDRLIRLLSDESEKADSHRLQIATGEAMRYLDFLKRFAPAREKK